MGWYLNGNLKGATGATGAQGPEGPAGPTPPETSGAIAYSGIYSAVSSAAPVATGKFGRVSLEGVVTSTAATFNANTQYTIGTLPSALAPSTTKWFVCVWNLTGKAVVSVTPAGAVLFSLDQTITLGAGALKLSLDGPVWNQK